MSIKPSGHCGNAEITNGFLDLRNKFTFTATGTTLTPQLFSLVLARTTKPQNRVMLTYLSAKCKWPVLSLYPLKDLFGVELITPSCKHITARTKHPNAAEWKTRFLQMNPRCQRCKKQTQTLGFMRKIRHYLIPRYILCAEESQRHKAIQFELI